ncbi:MAG TPA: hypothetical protein VFH97_02535, partial [Gemmatimonadales bacterium]|nr:hypothetical protein [Gemmatimonadales bacterium]
SLGRNEVIESFPVGRRFAFDAAKGRLWVICRKCERWNLSPLEERWEAFEQCERLFRATRVRMSTDQIGLARLPEGLELVRVGEPLRPEFAAWRYGDQFGRRRRRAFLLAGLGVAAFGALMTGAAVAGVGTGGLYGLWNVIANLPVRAKLRTGNGRVLRVRTNHLRTLRFFRDAEGAGWVITLKYRRLETFRGSEAERAATVLLPAVNLMAGSPAAVRDAVSRIEAAGSPDALLAQVTRGLPAEFTGRPRDRTARVQRLPQSTRLALEMALHEEQERRALAEDLVDLELAWREAEEIAGIADNLLVPAAHEEFIQRHRPPPEGRLPDGTG